MDWMLSATVLTPKVAGLVEGSRAQDIVSTLGKPSLFPKIFSATGGLLTSAVCSCA
jgi:hypothetical protein